MRPANQDNPIHCGKHSRKWSKTASGTIRYRCMVCGCTFTGGVWGSLPKGDRRLTQAEMQRRYRQRKKDQEKA